MQTSSQTLLSGDTVALGPYARQAVEVTGSPGAVDTSSVTPLQDGTMDKQEAYIVGTDDDKPVTLKALGNMRINGDAVLARNKMIYVIWRSDEAKWAEAGRG